MITNERVQDLINCLEDDLYESEKDIKQALIELLDLRKECQEWRDDAERLAKLFEVMDLYKISAKWEIAKKHIDEHNALVEKYKKCQDN